MEFVSTLLGLLGFGFGISAGILLGYFLFIYFQSSEEVKDPSVRTVRELDPKTLQRLMLDIPLWLKSPDFDRVDWFNKFVLEMWPYLDEAICATVRSSTKAMFDEYSQRYGLESIEFKTLTLGTLPPVIHDEFFVIESGIKAIDMNEKQLVLDAQIRWGGNPNVAVVVKLFSMELIIQLIDLQIFMMPRILLKPLIPTFPCFGNVIVSLMEEPHVDFGMKFLGGDIMAIPVLYHYVQKFIKAQIASLYLWPKSLNIPILDSSASMKKPVGILHAKVIRAKNLLKMDLFGKSDPYVKLKLSDERLPAKKTTIRMKSLNPEWNESFKLIVKDPATQVLKLHVYDWEKVGSHDKLGMQQIPLNSLVPCETKTITLPLMKSTNQNDPQNKTNRGEITVELTFDPFKEEIEQSREMLRSQETDIGSERPVDGSKSKEGLLLVMVHGAENVEGDSKTNPYAVIHFRGERKRTKVMKNNRNPTWDEEFQFMLEEPPQDERILIEVMSRKRTLPLPSKESLGHINVNLTDVLNNGRINEKYHLIDSKNGVIHVEIKWKAV